ncbi:hypothetical protein COCOBI_11-0170 [Coccomyxa sp. Obi]|nr:hypothetical protein COCOBI_11-0170 [Coccomyxa sp. Obi]
MTAWCQADSASVEAMIAMIEDVRRRPRRRFFHEAHAAALLQMGPPQFQFPFWDRAAFSKLVVAWRQVYQKEFPIDTILELPWNQKADKFRFLEQDAAKEYPQFLRPSFLRALDDAYTLHAAEIGDFLEEPVTKYPKSLILAAAASGSLAYIMDKHPLSQALPFLQQVFDEDSSAILVGICSLLRSNDPEMIEQAFQICQALKALPLVLGTLECVNSFYIQAIAVDSNLLDPTYFYKDVKGSLAADDSEGLLVTIRNYLEFQLMGIPSMQWSTATKAALFDALPKLPALLSSIPRLPALFSLAHGAPTKAALPLQGILPSLHLVQKAILNSGETTLRVATLYDYQRERIHDIMAIIDRADEARRAGFSNEEIWCLFKI